jgi:hypothetical protein
MILEDLKKKKLEMKKKMKMKTNENKKKNVPACLRCKLQNLKRKTSNK